MCGWVVWGASSAGHVHQACKGNPSAPAGHLPCRTGEAGDVWISCLSAFIVDAVSSQISDIPRHGKANACLHREGRFVAEQGFSLADIRL